MKFNETKSQERLINLMLQAGVEWPEKASHAMQGGRFGKVLFSSVKPKSVKPEGSVRGWNFTMAGPATNINHKPLPNWHQTIITREQYEARDGWITWYGGECPVDGDNFVETKWSDGDQLTDPARADPARVFGWHHDDDEPNIIAYRIHKPAQEQPETVTTAPTINDLIAYWQRKLAVADASRAQADHDAEQVGQAAAAVRKALSDAGWQL